MNFKKINFLSLACCIALMLGMLPSVSAAATFKDVAANAWYSTAVTFSCDQNYMNGMGGGKFAPDVKVNRAMLATVLNRISGNKVKFERSSFKDVKKSDWYFNGVEYCAQMGVVNGYGEGLFGPNDLLTRQDMVTMFYRFGKELGLVSDASRNLIVTYDDYKKVSSYARTAVNWALNSGVIDGVSYTKIDPLGTATRAQLAQVLMNFAERILEVDASAYHITKNNPYGIGVRNVRLYDQQLCFRLCGMEKYRTLWLELSLRVNGVECGKDITAFVSDGADYLYQGDASVLYHNDKFTAGAYLPATVVVKLSDEEECILTYTVSLGKILQQNGETTKLYLKGTTEFDSRILLYHDFSVTEPQPSQYGAVTTPERFEADIQYLLDEEYTFISLKELLEFDQGKRALPKKTVILNFDDGYKSNYTLAYPILQKYHIPVTIFMVISTVGGPNKLTWEQMIEMEQSGLVDIQSHSWKHEDHTQLSSQVLNTYIGDSFQVLDENLGKDSVRIFAYPYGKYSANAQAIATGYGVNMQVTTLWRALDLDHLDMLSIPRITVGHQSDITALIKVSK